MSNLALYLITVLVWGSTWFAIEFQLGIVEPEVSVVYRYAGASLLLFAWSKYKQLNLSFGIRQHGWFVLLGLFLFGLNYVFAYRAQIYITSAMTAIAFSSIVWMNILNARLFFGTRAGRRTIIGSLLGVVGIVTLFFGHLVGFLFPRQVMWWNRIPARLFILESTALIAPGERSLLSRYSRRLSAWATRARGVVSRFSQSSTVRRESRSQ